MIQPTRRQALSPITLVVAAALAVSAGPASAQSMKTKNLGGTQNGHVQGPPPCRIGQSDAGPVNPKNPTTRQVIVPLQRAEIVYAGSVWWVQAPGTAPQPTISYCVRLGLRNTGAAPWTKPVTLTIFDTRQGYRSNEAYDPTQATYGWPWDAQRALPLLVQSVPLIPSPVASLDVGQTAYNIQPGMVICQTNLEWRQRPSLFVVAKDQSGDALNVGQCPVDEFTAVSNAPRPREPGRVVLPAPPRLPALNLRP